MAQQPKKPSLVRSIFSPLCSVHFMLAIIISALLFSLVFPLNFLQISIIFRGKGEFLTVLLIFLFSLGFLTPKSCCGLLSLPFCRLKSVQMSFYSLFLCQTFICSLQQCKGRGSISVLLNTISLLAYFKTVYFKTAAILNPALL